MTKRKRGLWSGCVGMTMKMTLRKNGLWSECEGILAELVTAQVHQPDDVVSNQSLNGKGVFFLQNI